MPVLESHREEKLPVNYGNLFKQLTGKKFREKFTLNYSTGEASVLPYPANLAQRLICLLGKGYVYEQWIIRVVSGGKFIERANKAIEVL